MRRDGIRLSSPLQHKQLGQDGNRLEPDGEGPEDLRCISHDVRAARRSQGQSESANTHLGETVVVGEKQGQESADTEEVLDFEGVEVGVMGRLIFVQHQVDDVTGGSDEEQFEGGEVERVGQGPEQV